MDGEQEVAALRARVAFLEAAMQVACGQRETALNVVVEVTVQRDMQHQRADQLAERLKTLEGKLKTE